MPPRNSNGGIHSDRPGGIGDVKNPREGIAWNGLKVGLRQSGPWREGTAAVGHGELGAYQGCDKRLGC